MRDAASRLSDRFRPPLLLHPQTGRFRFPEWPIGERLSLTVSHRGFHTTTGALVGVGSAGFVGLHHEYAFQVPDVLTFEVSVGACRRSRDSGHGVWLHTGV